jgi:hypothetical protein
MIIGIVGFIGSGKGTVGDILESKGFSKDSFARPLKDAVSIIFGWPRELLEGDTEVSRKWRESADTFWSEKFDQNFTPRLALQLMGTEAGRNVFHKDLWVISLLNRAKGKNVVVTDVRFQNEIEYIQKNNGLIIRVNRGNDPPWFKMLENLETFEERNRFMSHWGVHQSEWNWVGSKFDYEIDNNGTLQDLRNNVEAVLSKIAF